VFYTYFSSVSFIFFCILQLLHIDVSKVDRVLHMGCAWEAASGVGGVRDGTTPLMWRSLTRKPNALGARSLTEQVLSDASQHSGSNVQALASPFVIM
jgi:hypothetical protein